MMMIDKTDLEIRSYLKCWYYNIKEQLEIYDTTKNETVVINNKDMENIFRELLIGYTKNRTHKIVGCDIMSGFVINLCSKEDVIKVAQRLWDHPENFYDLTDKDSYYDFLKYLWIESSEFPDETRLTDIVNTGSPI